MPHATCTWPAGGDIQQTHAKPPEGGYYSNWDPYAAELEVQPTEDVNPVRTQHVLVATVRDTEGEPLPNRRVEWIIAEGSVGDIVEVDESGWRASRGYKVDNHYAVSHTNNSDHVLDLGNDDPSDDIHLEVGQTWCVITSPLEGDTHVTVYAPGIYDWSKHKVFVTKHWYDVAWEFPPEATNPVGSKHELLTRVTKYSDGTPLAGYLVTYKILDGPAGAFEPGGQAMAAVETNADGYARVILNQAQPAEGTNNIEVDIMRPENEECCIPPVHIATGHTRKTWVGPKIAIEKTAPARATVNEQFRYNIAVTNPSDVDATEVVVSDTLPDGIAYVSSAPAARVQGQALSWSLGTLPARGTKPITVQVKATRAGTFENCAAVRAAQGLSARDCASTVVVAPQLALEKECSSEVLICDPIDYKIVVRNTGDGPATNVKISDRLPDGLATMDGKTVVTADVGTLEARQARQIQFQVKAQKTGTFVNKATASADGGLTAEATCETTVRQPVLEVTKTGPELRFVGREITYEITVQNTGDTPAHQTVLVDAVPAGTEFVQASDRGQFADGKVTWNLGTLAVDASRKVTLTLKPIRMGVVRNEANATARCAEARGSASTEVRGIPAVLLECIDLEDPDEIGTTETYVITVTNQGSADATSVQIVCHVQPEAEYVSSDGPTPATADARVVTFAPLRSLAPAAKAVYRVTVRSLSEGDTRFRVRLTTDQTDSPVEESESTRFYR